VALLEPWRFLQGVRQRTILNMDHADDQRLSLEVERLRTENLWRSVVSRDIPLSVAAATAFHQVHPATKTRVRRKEYDEALNISASAISRLAPIYTIGEVTRKRVEVRVNLVTHRFTLAASQLRERNGDGMSDNLFIERSDLLFAISIIKRAGLPFSFALMPDESLEGSAKAGDQSKTDKGRRE
jgi:hypothetical protein